MGVMPSSIILILGWSIRPTCENGRLSKKLVVFNENDGFRILQTHNDPLAIFAEIVNYEVTRVFVNNDSLVNVIFISIFDQLGVNNDLLGWNLAPLIAFEDNMVHLIR